MTETQDRVQDFKQEIADMRVRDPATGRDRRWLRMGVGLMVAGLIVAVIAYPLSHGTSNPLSQTDALALGLGGIAGTIVGAALFLRYSIAGFLRFWLARLSYEQQTQTDRIVDKLGD
ncbi:MAG TPA: hypothetical protein VFF40_02665 [Acidimicrobiia bacterium]|nr:hypothetical protein [Acidimicrobiia bacterium]